MKGNGIQTNKQTEKKHPSFIRAKASEIGCTRGKNVSDHTAFPFQMETVLSDPADGCADVQVLHFPLSSIAGDPGKESAVIEKVKKVLISFTPSEPSLPHLHVQFFLAPHLAGWKRAAFRLNSLWTSLGRERKPRIRIKLSSLSELHKSFCYTGFFLHLFLPVLLSLLLSLPVCLPVSLSLSLPSLSLPFFLFLFFWHPRLFYFMPM